MLEAILDQGIQRFIFSRSCATCGIPKVIPLAEDHPQIPINPYGASMLMIERILQDFDNAHGIKSISLGYINATGDDPDGDHGEDHNPNTHKIPLVLDELSELRENIKIFGDGYDSPDGNYNRKYINVSVLANAHVLALQVLNSSTNSSVYNLRYGN